MLVFVVDCGYAVRFAFNRIAADAFAHMSVGAGIGRVCVLVRVGS